MAATCPVKDCTSAQKPGQLLCRPHWFATPLDLRGPVLSTWRAYQRARTPDARLAALKPYRAARGAVLSWWEQA